ncbi:hypothetical protein ON058_04885 [Demequina sp. B12]|uniref:hypothetical protein n=1 Tax=Demequina sp. B12 TaxID=2992757 RepID=UPI00237C1515|nr:hypothetical protein [Demequina sp. B12]MDE0572750.1 hypothetical protein [Demequina sp. B12]
MAEEYVPVEPPRPERGRHRRQRPQAQPPDSNGEGAGRDPSGEPPRGRAKARVLALGACVALALAVGVVLAGADDDEPIPEHTNAVTAADARAVTAVAYAEFQGRLAAARCSADEGFPYEPRIVDQEESLARVANFLGLTPMPMSRANPVPMLRQPDLYLSTYGTVDETVPGTKNCPVSVRIIDTGNEALVGDLVAQARQDRHFRATVAEQVWVRGHPAEVTHLMALLRVDRQQPSVTRPDSFNYWAGALEVVESALYAQEPWVPVATTRADDFAQSTGVLANGRAVALRVGEPEEVMGVGSYLTRVDVIACGPLSISAGVRMPWGSASDLATVMDGLAPACNALIGADYVTAETLAEVYWD